MQAPGQLARLGRAVVGAALAALIAGTAQAAPPTPRQLAQHVLRRFAYSASPAMIDAVVAQGTDAWLAEQLNWPTIYDSKSQLNTPPTAFLTDGNCQGCLPNYDAFEAMVYQHSLLTKRQVQAKLELHWLDHFSISQAQIDRPSMYTYDAAVRANALGNFTQLVSAVAMTPAMLWWLDNNDNDGSGPNVNWARELMQLFTIGEWQLNPDGSQVLGKTGLPVPNYAEADIKAMARAMSGYHVVYLDSGNPMANFMVVFNPQKQYPGRLRFLGALRNVPHTSKAMGYVANILAHHPSAAPFQVTELLKRFVTETPSPRFISDIVAVWTKNQDAPDQIAQVVAAIVKHPEFATAYHAMPKQPIEKIFGALRQLPGRMQAAPPKGFTWWPYRQAGGTLQNYMLALNQSIFVPPSVFSFYLPGHLASMTTGAARVGQTWAFSDLLNESPSVSPNIGTGADVWIDLPTLLATIHSSDGPVIANYLLDALVDGGSPGLRRVVAGFLGGKPGTGTVIGAIWLILNSPEYAVN